MATVDHRLAFGNSALVSARHNASSSGESGPILACGFFTSASGSLEIVAALSLAKVRLFRPSRCPDFRDHRRHVPSV
ncbi:MAG: hypothetical protein V4801_17565, partial [Burkholderia gladioli]